MDLKDLTCSESRPGEGGCLLTADSKETAKPTLLNGPGGLLDTCFSSIRARHTKAGVSTS